jgi:hypothetical protein
VVRIEAGPNSKTSKAQRLRPRTRRLQSLSAERQRRTGRSRWGHGRNRRGGNLEPFRSMVASARSHDSPKRLRPPEDEHSHSKSSQSLFDIEHCPQKDTVAVPATHSALARRTGNKSTRSPISRTRPRYLRPAKRYARSTGAATSWAIVSSENRSPGRRRGNGMGAS